MSKIYMVTHPTLPYYSYYEDKEEAINCAWELMEKCDYEDDIASDIYEYEKIDDNTISFENKKLIGTVCYTEPELDFFEEVL